jgi:hypothetical protein
MPTHCQLTPADGILISFTLNIGKKLPSSTHNLFAKHIKHETNPTLQKSQRLSLSVLIDEKLVFWRLHYLKIEN